MRLRTVTWRADGRQEFKLGKKYERDDPLAGPITSIYLTAEEHAALAGLRGRRLSKVRYDAPPFGVDVFEGALAGLVLAECEAATREAALAIPAPAWAVREVTHDAFFTGWSLARATAAELAERLAS